MHLLPETLSLGSGIFLLIAIGLALSFECVNGFHDTANAVATVIYTHSLPAWVAVIWSGLCNLAGVLIYAGPVAFAIVALLPVDLVLNVGTSAGFAMIFALLISAIIWNLGTWYLGLPASSSHTLIGAIMGVGLANSMMAAGSVHNIGAGVNWSKAGEVFAALLISPLIGFLLSAGLLLVARLLLRKPELYKAPPKDTPPPWWIRGLLICTCTGVSFSHGSNDGQKGMGLMLLILIGILPGTYALDLDRKADDIHKLQATTVSVQQIFQDKAQGKTLTPELASAELSRYLKSTEPASTDTMAALSTVSQQIGSTLEGKSTLRDVPMSARKDLRTDFYLVSDSVARMAKQHQLETMAGGAASAKVLSGYKTQIEGVTQFIPTWVKVAVACALGFGTMVGWKRIVLTVGERIGKEHLTYAQGASAELVAMGTIGMASWFGMPVSTTHVLSSGVAGTMVANGSGLQMATVRNIALAWLLTLPVCVLLGSATFAFGLFAVFHTSVSVILGTVILAAMAYGAVKWHNYRRRHGEIELSMAGAPAA